MSKQYKTGLVLFRRDLRLHDHKALYAALRLCEAVIPCFIVDPRQVGEENNYRSMNCIEFMVESLIDLDQQLQEKGSQLYVFYGIAHELLERLIDTVAIDAVFFNRDYTPFSIARDEHLEQVCNRRSVAYQTFADVLLHEPHEVQSQGGTPYAVFTAFYKKSLLIPLSPPEALPRGQFYTQPIALDQKENIYTRILPAKNKSLHVHGGRKQAKKLLAHLEDVRNYLTTRDTPALPTSNLSAHLKFGTLSVREVYTFIQESLGKNHPLLRQLYWRDFFTHIAYHSPFVFGHAFQQKYDSLPWEHSQQLFERWCQGATGFPIVDAGMRQLNETGYMHNRVRMIVASFLTKDLRIDWRWGERYFAQKLVDYDPAVNNGNWQWSASTGCDAQPYFRIFNPWLQQKKFDPECTYIKRWLPECKSMSITTIHSWEKTKAATSANYPKPMVDHSVESAKTKLWFKAGLVG